MKTLTHLFRQLVADERGSVAVEHAVVLALGIASAAAAIATFGPKIAAAWAAVDAAL